LPKEDASLANARISNKKKLEEKVIGLLRHLEAIRQAPPT
jgi:hypothetical protein